MNTNQKEGNEKKLINLSWLVTVALILIMFSFLLEGIYNEQSSSAIMTDTFPGLALILVLVANIIRLNRRSRTKN